MPTTCHVFSPHFTLDPIVELGELAATRRARRRSRCGPARTPGPRRSSRSCAPGTRRGVDAAQRHVGVGAAPLQRVVDDHAAAPARPAGPARRARSPGLSWMIRAWSPRQAARHLGVGARSHHHRPCPRRRRSSSRCGTPRRSTARRRTRSRPRRCRRRRRPTTRRAAPSDRRLTPVTARIWDSISYPFLNASTIRSRLACTAGHSPVASPRTRIDRRADHEVRGRQVERGQSCRRSAAPMNDTIGHATASPRPPPTIAIRHDSASTSTRIRAVAEAERLEHGELVRPLADRLRHGVGRHQQDREQHRAGDARS